MSKRADKDLDIKSIQDIEEIEDIDDLEKAILIIALMLQKTSDKELKKILVEYKRQLDSLRQELSYIYVNDASIDIDGSLNMNYADKYKVEQKLNKSIKNMSSKLSEHEKTIVSLALFNAYKDSYYKTNDVISKQLKQNSKDNDINYDDIDYDSFKMLDSDEIDNIVNQAFKGDTYSNRIIKNNRLLQLELANTIKQGLEQNKSIYLLNEEIKEVFSKSAYRSKRLLETELFRVHNLAILAVAIDVYGLNRVRYSAILDNRTCQTCGNLDNQTFFIQDAPSLPAHANCRCELIPII